MASDCDVTATGATLRITSDGGSGILYEVEGTEEQVTAEVDRLLRAYPAPGYGTWFNWPPGSRTIQWGEKKGQPVAYLAPTSIGNGRWRARGHRSSNCD